MDTLNILFSNNSSIVIHEGDSIIPILRVTKDSESYACKGRPVVVSLHTSEGLIPSLMDALVLCDYFCLASDQSNIYGTKTIVRISTK